MYDIVPQATQERAMAFLAEQAFATPAWMIDEDILTRIEHAGAVERIRQRQVGVVNNVLDPSRMQRLIESGARMGEEAYTLADMMVDLRSGVWTELQGRGEPIDTYRRNLQRGYLERMKWLMTEEPPRPTGPFARFFSNTTVDVSQSDIRAFVRGELNALKQEIQIAIPRAPDTETRYHLEDALVRIEEILYPNGRAST